MAQVGPIADEDSGRLGNILRQVAWTFCLLRRHRQQPGIGPIPLRRETASPEVVESARRETATYLGEVPVDGTAIPAAPAEDHGSSAAFVVKELAGSRVRK